MGVHICKTTQHICIKYYYLETSERNYSRGYGGRLVLRTPPPPQRPHGVLLCYRLTEFVFKVLKVPTGDLCSLWSWEALRLCAGSWKQVPRKRSQGCRGQMQSSNSQVTAGRSMVHCTQSRTVAPESGHAAWFPASWSQSQLLRRRLRLELPQCLFPLSLVLNLRTVTFLLLRVTVGRASPWYKQIKIIWFLSDRLT